MLCTSSVDHDQRYEVDSTRTRQPEWAARCLPRNKCTEILLLLLLDCCCWIPTPSFSISLLLLLSLTHPCGHTGSSGVQAYRSTMMSRVVFAVVTGVFALHSAAATTLRPNGEACVLIILMIVFVPLSCHPKKNMCYEFSPTRRYTHAKPALVWQTSEHN